MPWDSRYKRRSAGGALDDCGSPGCAGQFADRPLGWSAEHVPSLVELQLYLRPGPKPPKLTGPAEHAALLAALGRVDPDLAEAVHAPGGLAPIAISPILPTGPRKYRVKVGTAIDGFFGAPPTEPGPLLVALDELRTLRIGQAVLDVDDRSGHMTSWEDLGADMEGARAFEVTFETPWVVRVPDRAELPRRAETLPIPGLLLRAPLRRLVEAGRIDENVAQLVPEYLAVTRHRLRTAAHLVSAPSAKRRDTRLTGCVGSVRYSVSGRPPAPVAEGAAAAFDLMRFVGSGDQTAKGMGSMSVEGLKGR